MKQKNLLFGPMLLLLSAITWGCSDDAKTVTPSVSDSMVSEVADPDSVSEESMTVSGQDSLILQIVLETKAEATDYVITDQKSYDAFNTLYQGLCEEEEFRSVFRIDDDFFLQKRLLVHINAGKAGEEVDATFVAVDR